MKKQIDIRKSIYDICSDHPEVIEIMRGLGFNDIANPKMLTTVGRFMTISKGATMKRIPLSRIRSEFEKNGYEIIGD